MQAKTEMLVRRNGRIFVALCIILFMGCTVQGAPVQKGRYMWVKCRPGAHSANCVEEKGPHFAIPDGSANMILPPNADPTLMKTLQHRLVSLPYNGDEYGSGNYMESESGSGLEYEADDLSTSSSVINLPDEKLNLKLSNEDLFFQGNKL